MTNLPHHCCLTRIPLRNLQLAVQACHRAPFRPSPLKTSPSPPFCPVPLNVPLICYPTSAGRAIKLVAILNNKITYVQNYIQTERHMGKYNSVPFDGAGFKITGFIFSVFYSKAIEAIVTV